MLQDGKEVHAAAMETATNLMRESSEKAKRATTSGSPLGGDDMHWTVRDEKVASPWVTVPLPAANCAAASSPWVTVPLTAANCAAASSPWVTVPLSAALPGTTPLPPLLPATAALSPVLSDYCSLSGLDCPTF